MKPAEQRRFYDRFGVKVFRAEIVKGMRLSAVLRRQQQQVSAQLSVPLWG